MEANNMANYCYKLDPEDDVMPVRAFRDMVKYGVFIDYDGFGYPVKDHLADHDIIVKPSQLETIPADATHIVWFNR